MFLRLKQWLRTVGGTQRDKRFQIDFSGTISKAMLKSSLRNATKVRSRRKFKKYQMNFIASPLKLK